MNSMAVEVEVDLPEGVRIRGYERHQGAHAFEVEFDLPARCRCPKCGEEAEVNVRYKQEMLAIRDLDLLGQPGFWVYQPPMHQCPHCRQRTQIPTPFKRPRVTYTYRFEQWVLEQAVEASVEEVARRLSVSAEMIEEILEHQLAAERQIAPERVITSVGFDELSLKKRHKLYATVMTDLSDPAHPLVLAVAKGHDRAATEACLAKLSPEQRTAVRSHRTDMSAVYPEICAEWLPNSQLVVDRFHVAKQLSAIVDRLRKNTSSQASVDSSGEKDVSIADVAVSAATERLDGGGKCRVGSTVRGHP
jgi:transposase